ncbi:MAG: peroxidase [Planctomycetota bacterium]|nr:peroxidase [Planctomycetota bacterium]
MADWLEKQGWEEAPLSLPERALCKWAEKLTTAPGAMGEADVLELQEQGWSDLEIHDAAQVVAYFNYINRLADGLGVDLEEEMK